MEINTARLQQQKAAEKRQQAVLSKAKRALEDSRFLAPYTGHVLSVDAEIGQYLSSSNKLATLVSGGDVEVRFTLSQDQYGTLLASGNAITGLPVQIVWRSGQTNIACDGEVRRVVAEVAEKSGSMILYAILGEEEMAKKQLPIGSFVDIELTSQPVERVVTLPERALYAKDLVYLIEDSKLVSRQVQPLSWSNGEVMISAGLNVGERVLVTHLPNAKAGMPVEVILQ
jgi:RND family efflux transporter MFP subunit